MGGHRSFPVGARPRIFSFPHTLGEGAVPSLGAGAARHACGLRSIVVEGMPFWVILGRAVGVAVARVMVMLITASIFPFGAILPSQSPRSAVPSADNQGGRIAVVPIRDTYTVHHGRAA